MQLDRCPGPVSRRSFLQAGDVGVGGLGLNPLMAMRARAAADAPKDTQCIFVWLPGGTPHMEMYDMKPDAPAEYRGEFFQTANAFASYMVNGVMR